MVGQGMKAAAARCAARLLVAAGLVSSTWVGVARAEGTPCTTQNLLTGRQAQVDLVRRDAGLITDGTIALDGSRWNDDTAVILDTGASSLTIDLGAQETLSAAYLQADANDSYDLLGSPDGTPGSFKLLTRLPNVVNQGHGLRARVATFDPQTLRFVKLTNARGDDFFSVSELAAYCKPPTPFPPLFRVAASAETGRPPVNALTERQAVIAKRTELCWILALGLSLLGLVTYVVGRGRARKQAAVKSAPLDPAQRRERLLLAMFLASGCAALIYEVVWVHLLRLVIGASALSVGIVLASFMGGMFVGSLLFARWVARRHQPLRVYALIELGIGVCGVLMPVILPFVRSVYAESAGHGPLGIALRALIAAILLLPPTALMGATLPAIARRYPEEAEARPRLAGLYAANTLGAVLGCLLAGFYLLAVWDVWVATLTAAALNFAVAAFAWRSARGDVRTAPPLAAAEALEPLVPLLDLKPAEQPKLAEGAPAGLIFVAIGLSGATALGAQVLWTRLLTLLFGATVYAFSIILAVFLGGLGIGAVLAARALARGLAPARGLLLSQLGLLPLLLWAAALLAEVLPYSSPSTLTPVPVLHALHVLRAIEVMLPAAILWGMSFPFALAAVRHDDPSRATGQVYAANTVGSIFGALSVSFFAIPVYGTHWAAQVLILVAALSAATICAGLLRATSFAPRLGTALFVLGLGAACAALTPAISGVFLAHGRHIWSVDPSDQYPYISEGAASTVAVHIAPDGSRNFHVSGRVEASTNPADMRLQRLLGHISALAHPKPESVLVVGLGAGVTAGAIARHPEVKRIVICEIEPRVTGAAREFSRENYAVLDDPRVEVVFDDARHFLATTDERFDIITSDPIHPWVRGNSVLFSREYYEIVKARLRPHGIATQWVPLYDTSERAIQIQMRTFLAAFPDGSVWNSSNNNRGYDVVLLGQNKREPFDLPSIQRRLEGVPRIADSLREVGVYNTFDLFATYGASAGDMRKWVASASENRDFSLKLEYISGLSLNQQNADLIYSHMVAERTVPESLFAGPPDMVRLLRARILAAKVGQRP
ncbi:MAG TPA: fused MFS/spermidine synthase [Polyangiales bacterium]|nr:fused MFS/spermidine synthase [Polyangiales bacterium]